jgi:hypothetical protein
VAATPTASRCVDGDPTLLAGSLGASRDRVADDLLVDSPSDQAERLRTRSLYPLWFGAAKQAVVGGTSMSVTRAASEPVFCYRSDDDRDGAFFVVPVQLAYHRPSYRRRSRPIAATAVDENPEHAFPIAPAIPAFAASSESRWDDVTDRGRVYPRHVLEAVHRNRWLIHPEHLWAKGGQQEIAGHPNIAVELWQFATSEFRAAVSRATNDERREAGTLWRLCTSTVHRMKALFGGSRPGRTRGR